MAAAAPAPAPGAAAPAPKQTSALRRNYLIAYNLISTVLWAAVLNNMVSTAGSSRGFDAVHASVGPLLRWTQTLAALEIVHAALGVVRAPLATTAMQVASRFVLVWGVAYPFPSVVRSPAYSSMITAWGVTEVIRYSFFFITLAGGEAGFLVWLRYNTFFLLYPVGIASECWLMWQAATGPAAALSTLYPWVFYAILAIYVPGSYVLYTHMMAQRRKFMRAQKAEAARKTK